MQYKHHQMIPDAKKLGASSEVSKEVTVEYYEGDLPKVSFTWYPELYCPDADDNNHFPRLPSKRSFTICNFRRYGWATAPGQNAEYGYDGPDAIWANGCGPCFTCTPEEVISTTLATTMERAVEYYGAPPRILWSTVVKKIMRRLLDDALANAAMWAVSTALTANNDHGVTVHASPRAMHGECGCGDGHEEEACPNR